MRLGKGTHDIFDLKCDAVCVTTNGITKANGHAVMGAGIAKQADELYNLAPALGMKLKMHGNHCYDMGEFRTRHVVTFPTKNHWKDDSDLNLIAQSCKELTILADKNNWQVVVLPPVGTGCGKLSWESVKKVLKENLDDRFVIYFRHNGGVDTNGKV